jgi:rubrerythrin
VDHTLAILRRAIQNEIAGQRFYSDAAYHCIDPWAKELFATLAVEEENHARLLLVEYDALETHGRWIDPDKALSDGVNIDITTYTFPEDDNASSRELFPVDWSAREAVDRRADDLAALAFGIKMEQDALDLYGQELVDTEDPAARKAYRFLIDEETQHYNDLKEQWENLAGMPFGGA